LYNKKCYKENSLVRKIEWQINKKQKFEQESIAENFLIIRWQYKKVAIKKQIYFQFFYKPQLQIYPTDFF
jgi:hypothetical protein